MQHYSMEGTSPVNVVADAFNQPSFHTKSQHSPSWYATTPEGGGDHAPSNSSSATYTNSSNPTPGGLYATSINGARMPCTIRARKKSRLIPGATLIRPVTDPLHAVLYGQDVVEFPDTTHISVDHTVSSTDSISPLDLALENSTYEEMCREFGKLCRNENDIFPALTSARYPAYLILNMFIKLYLDNSDSIISILHEQVIRIMITGCLHWRYAQLAVSTLRQMNFPVL
jgi:hypothetical protein